MQVIIGCSRRIYPMQKVGHDLEGLHKQYDHKWALKCFTSFDVSVEGTVVFSWWYPLTDDNSNFSAYSDLYAYIHNGVATICFYSIGTDVQVIGSS